MEDRINFNKSYKLFEACATDLMRPAMEHVFFMNDMAYASDSKILVRVPLGSCTLFDESEWKKLNGFAINKHVLKMLYAFDMVFIERDDEAGTCCFRAQKEGHDIIFKLKTNDEVKAPNFEAVISDRKEAEPITKIGINPSFLYRLSRATNLKTVCMKVSKANGGPIFIEDPYSGSLSLIMPTLFDD